MRHRLGHIQQEPQFNRGQPIGVEIRAVVGDFDVLITLLELRNLLNRFLCGLLRAENPHALLHQCTQFAANLSR